jgi:hypothetical protein
VPPSPIPVSDLLSNWNDQMATAARILGRSKHRHAVFETIYRGKKQVKTIKEIMKETGLSQVHVLNEGGKMAGLLVEKVPSGYKKKKEFAARYLNILGLARDRKKLERLPTKISPKGGASAKITVSFPRLGQNAKFISIDDIDSFSKVRGTPIPAKHIKPLREKKLKLGFAKIIGEKGSFKDWGGEKSDLFSTKLRIAGRRVRAAIAFKGKATKGKLVPGKMGKNGDQINRLFDEPAQVFPVAYKGQIDSSIISQMQAFAIGNALKGGRIYYGVIDGSDIERLVSAYPNCF